MVLTIPHLVYMYIRPLLPKPDRPSPSSPCCHLYSQSPWPSLDGPRSRRPHGEFWQHLEEQWRQELGALAPGLEGGRQLIEGLAGGLNDMADVVAWIEGLFPQGEAGG
jgi:hypothetical protein